MLYKYNQTMHVIKIFLSRIKLTSKIFRNKKNFRKEYINNNFVDNFKYNHDIE